jgi:hypothetical protein
VVIGETAFPATDPPAPADYQLGVVMFATGRRRPSLVGSRKPASVFDRGGPLAAGHEGVSEGV